MGFEVTETTAVKEIEQGGDKIAFRAKSGYFDLDSRKILRLGDTEEEHAQIKGRKTTVYCGGHVPSRAERSFRNDEENFGDYQGGNRQTGSVLGAGGPRKKGSVRKTSHPNNDRRNRK